MHILIATVKNANLPFQVLYVIIYFAFSSFFLAIEIEEISMEGKNKCMYDCNYSLTHDY